MRQGPVARTLAAWEISKVSRAFLARWRDTKFMSDMTTKTDTIDPDRCPVCGQATYRSRGRQVHYVPCGTAVPRKELSMSDENLHDDPTLVEVGQIRIRITYAMKVVDIHGVPRLDGTVCILEGVEDGRRTTVDLEEVRTWRLGNPAWRDPSMAGP